MDSYAAEGTLYLNSLHVSAAAFPTNITTGLYFETLEAFRRTGLVSEAVGGLHQPERPGLHSFKLSLGFKVAYVPSYHHILGPVDAVFRRMRPMTHYRLTGDAGRAADQIGSRSSGPSRRPDRWDDVRGSRQASAVAASPTGNVSFSDTPRGATLHSAVVILRRTVARNPQTTSPIRKEVQTI